MVANAAFLVGLTLGLAPDVERTLSQLTFGQARRNFYAAAREGLDATLLWPRASGLSPRVVPAPDLAEELLPVARQGLVAAGVLADEADERLAVVARRLAGRMTGAKWQRTRLGNRRDPAAFSEMLARYLELAEGGSPVAEWP
jgi:hypothetical protein